MPPPTPTLGSAALRAVWALAAVQTRMAFVASVSAGTALLDERSEAVPVRLGKEAGPVAWVEELLDVWRQSLAYLVALRVPWRR